MKLSECLEVNMLMERLSKHASSRKTMASKCMSSFSSCPDIIASGLRGLDATNLANNLANYPSVTVEPASFIEAVA